MKRVFWMLIFVVYCTSATAQVQPSRPPILGIGSVRINLTTYDDAVVFYINQLGLGGGITNCRGASKACVEINKHQRIDIYGENVTFAEKPSVRTGRLSEIDFETSDVRQLRRYLQARGIRAGDIIETPGSNLYFSTVDPDGHQIGFIQYTSFNDLSHPDSQVSSRLIHAGFIVHDRSAEDHFYKDILGFHVYWHGGMKEDETNWVDMQVPDGTNWIEYMLNVPANADHHTLGVMNHIALGVPDIKAAREQLLKNGWKPGEEPKIGRDGKWQLNLYDPDDTRVELMEFTPTQKPCCADYTGPHPGPKQ